MEISQASSQPARGSGNGFRLRTKTDSISSSISSSILFTVDEQDEEISFDNPIFRQYKDEAKDDVREEAKDETKGVEQ